VTARRGGAGCQVGPAEGRPLHSAVRVSRMVRESWEGGSLFVSYGNVLFSHIGVEYMFLGFPIWVTLFLFLDFREDGLHSTRWLAMVPILPRERPSHHSCPFFVP